MDWFSAIFAFEEWPMWPLAVDAASNWRERQRFRSRSSHLIPTLYSGTRSRPPQTSANVCLVKVSLEVPELDYLWENSSLDRLDFLTFEAFLWSSWLTQFSCNEEAGRWLSPGNEAKENKLLVAGWINDNLFWGVVLHRGRFEERMWGGLSLGVVLHMVGSSASIQCYDCNKKDRFREMVRATPNL